MHLAVKPNWLTQEIETGGHPADREKAGERENRAASEVKLKENRSA